MLEKLVYLHHIAVHLVDLKYNRNLFDTIHRPHHQLLLFH
jgi:hypothetical protein